MSEKVLNKVENVAKSTKDFVLKGYHRLADYLEKKSMERKIKNSNVILKMNCVKYLLVLLNIFYLFIALSMIIFGTSGVLFSNYTYRVYYLLDAFNVLSILWMSAGIYLACISIFALIASFKESVISTNLYGVLLIIAFFLQISVAITAISHIGNSRFYATDLIKGLIRNYEYYDDTAASRLDWMQKTFQCCGLDGPSDWYNNNAFYRDTQYPFWLSRLSTSTSTTEQPLNGPSKYRTPASCCTKESSYQNSTCENYFEEGCGGHMREIISSSIMIMGTIALTISVFQILGIVTAFTLARVLRRTKSYRHIPKPDTLSQRVFDTHTHIDYTPLDNNNE